MPTICECPNGPQRGSFNVCLRCGGEYLTGRGRAQVVHRGTTDGVSRPVAAIGCDQPDPANEERAQALLTPSAPLKEGKRRLVGTIDLTPSWRDLLPTLLTLVECGGSAGRQTAMEELNRMALAADAYVAISKKGVE